MQVEAKVCDIAHIDVSTVRPTWHPRTMKIRGNITSMSHKVHKTHIDPLRFRPHALSASCCIDTG